MKTTIGVSLLLFLFFFNLNGQDKYFIRSDFGMNNPIVKSNTEALTREFMVHRNMFPNPEVFLGLYVGRSVKKDLNVETGINYLGFSNRYFVRLDSIGVGGSTGSSRSSFFIIPLNLSYNLKIPNSKFSIVPHIGISYISNLHNVPYRTDITFDKMGSSNNNLAIINKRDTITTFITKPASNYSLLLSAGLGFEYRISENVGITLNGNYSFGLNEINSFVVLVKRKYHDNLNDNLSYKGTHYYLACGIKIYL
jgi:hypothetical protein